MSLDCCSGPQHVCASASSHLPRIASSAPFAPCITSDTFFTSSFISLVASSRVLADFSWPRPPRLASLSACVVRVCVWGGVAHVVWVKGS